MNKGGMIEKKTDNSRLGPISYSFYLESLIQRKMEKLKTT
jgi:hypothetical protein